MICATAKADVDEIRLFVPAFKGPNNLGKNVATILNLQVWRTLRMEPDRDPQGENFGLGMIVWSESSLANASHVFAEETATSDNISSQFVLWGETFPYGNGMITQTYLSIPVFGHYERDGMKLNDFRDNYYEIWKLPIRVNQKSILLEVDIPNRRYEFSPIILSQSIVNQYSLPSKLTMYIDADKRSKVIGEVGNKYIGIEPSGHYQKVYSDGKRGWVYLPDLAKEQNEVVNFIGGLIRIYRADWHGAKDLMDKVITNKSTPVALKIDALLYKGRCLEEIGESGESAFKLAYRLNQYNHYTIRFWMMSRLSKLIRIRQENVKSLSFKENLKKTKLLVAENEFLFSQNDPWLIEVVKILNEMEKG